MSHFSPLLLPLYTVCMIFPPSPNGPSLIINGRLYPRPQRGKKMNSHRGGAVVTIVGKQDPIRGGVRVREIGMVRSDSKEIRGANIGRWIEV